MSLEIQKKEVLLTVSDINITLGNRKILTDVNFQIRDIIRPGVLQGQVCSILGKSGIGKSTLYNILSGLLEPDKGQVLVNETQDKVKVGDMGVVFQDYFIYPWRRVRKILKLSALKNKNIDKKDIPDAIKEFAESFDLTSHLDKFPFELSGGQKQRVAIAEQLLNGCNFLLLDEPFSGLDIIMIEKVIGNLTKISTSDEKKTIVIVSHDLSNSLAISDMVYIMNVRQGTEGATIIKEIDMIERNLAYHPEIKEIPLFRETLKEVRSYMV